MATNNNVKDRYKKTLLEIINKNIPNCKVYLFGSRANGTNRSGADIDLAIDIGRIKKEGILWES